MKRLFTIAPLAIAMPFVLGMRECDPEVPLGGECPQGACGAALGVPAITCWDGSTGGNTGLCRAGADGVCGWEIRDCPLPPDDCAESECGAPPLSPRPISCDRAADGECHWVLEEPTACSPEDCGPAPGAPSWTCADGTVGGFTGRCERNAAGACEWLSIDCPRGEGCSIAECGPAPGSPTCLCADGTSGCNTGRCIRDPSGACGWEWRECPGEPVSCGSRTTMGIPGCDDGFLCAYAREDICGAADVSGTCQREPSARECDAIGASGETQTVCGCDGVTYASECHAWAAGTSAASAGACGGGAADCDLRDVLCDALPPACPSGEVPSQVGACYGPCVPVSECRGAPCSADGVCSGP